MPKGLSLGFFGTRICRPAPTVRPIMEGDWACERYMCRCCRISCTGINIGDRDEGCIKLCIPPSSTRTTETKEVADDRDQGLTNTSQGPRSYATSSRGCRLRCLILLELTIRSKWSASISRDQEDEITSFPVRVSCRGPSARLRVSYKVLTSTNKVPVTTHHFVSSGSTQTRPPE
ncbi:hypothetical protein EDD36DRAFT_69723 [Exophiala viscosa]|uniref:Uncharacterized protein n=1 Tax=Exophiala viscosa TaxID=2486360 RepID=A0AAN6IA20_9EURO|nr:hypothetical protein EDD36DRAFT_69723 [Exophiala viscosa]